jgi:hypothetical protein
MASPEPSQDEIASLVYERAMGELEAQRGELDELRGRAGVILGAASIASSFLGGFALGSDASLGTPQWVAIGAFVVLGGLTLAILWPYDWQFGWNPYLLVSEYLDADPPKVPADVRRDLAIYAGDSITGNVSRLKVLWWLYRLAIGALVVLIAGWLIGMGGT